MELLKILEDHFFEMEEDLVKKIKSESGEYQNLCDEMEQLENQYPIIRELLGGRNVDHDCHLSRVERRAINQYEELRFQANDMLNRKRFVRDHQEVILPIAELRGKEKEESICSIDFFIDGAIEAVDKATVLNLKKKKRYRKLLKERNDLSKRYSIIEQVLEGKGKVKVNEEEHHALNDYLDIIDEMEVIERQEYYLWGLRHAIKFHQLLSL